MPPKPSPTHFLCLPLAGTQLGHSWAAFRADVTSPTSFAIPPDAVRPLGTLHLTLGVMSLRDEAALEQAVGVLGALRPREALASARSKTAAAVPSGSGAGGLSVTLRGLHVMQAPSKAGVLYAPPEDAEGTLYDFCSRLRQPFRDAGLMGDDGGRPLLLHATVVNTIYVRNGGGGAGAGARGGKGDKGKRRGSRLTIDAREMLARYDDYLWAEQIPVSKVALCRMGAKDVEGTDDKVYEVEAEVNL